MKPRYLVIGGIVRSKTDGDYHYVYSRELAALYGLTSDDDVTLAEENGSFLKGFDMSSFIVLRPRYDGDYSLPTVNN